MTAETVSDNSAVLICEGTHLTDAELSRALREALERKGESCWGSIEADVFTYNGRTLVLARPAPPTLEKATGGVRLKRK